MTRLPKIRTDGAPPWRALLSDPGAEWSQLPFTVRAIAAEMLRRLDADRCIVAAPGKAVADAVCMAMGVSTAERRTVRAALVTLERGRWIELRADRLVAYFPDLGRDRPPTRTEHDSSATLTRVEHDSDTTLAEVLHDSDTTLARHEQKACSQNELTPTPDTKHDVERREEERREEKIIQDARASAVPDPPLGRLLKGFQRRWESKRLPSGQALGAGWPGFGKHRGRADELASSYADKPDALERALDAYFAADDDPFVVSVGWNFATFANDPERWLRPRRPKVMRAEPAAHDADESTPVTENLFLRREPAA